MPAANSGASSRPFRTGADSRNQFVLFLFEHASLALTQSAMEPLSEANKSAQPVRGR